jgi:adenine phosphoribosyltransferase
VDHELRRRLIETFRWIDLGPESTHLVSDVSGWWRDPVVLARIGPALARLVDDALADDVLPDHTPTAQARPLVVVAPETTGLLLGPLVATALGAGFVPAHKQTDRRIAEPTTWVRTPADYRGRQLTLGLRDRHLTPGDRVVLVDDWAATAAQLRALHALARARGAVVVGAVTIVADCPPDVAAELGLRSLLTGDDLADAPVVRTNGTDPHHTR